MKSMKRLALCIATALPITAYAYCDTETITVGGSTTSGGENPNAKIGIEKLDIRWVGQSNFRNASEHEHTTKYDRDDRGIAYRRYIDARLKVNKRDPNAPHPAGNWKLSQRKTEMWVTMTMFP